MKIKRSILWIGCSLIVAVVSFGGLVKLGPVTADSSLAIFHLAGILYTIFWLSFFSLILSLLCWSAPILFKTPRNNGY